MNESSFVKERVNIVDVVSENVSLARRGANYFGLCPFHQEKSPSFSVNENLQIFKCFGCGESGDVFSYYMRYHNCDFRTAIEEIADRFGIVLPNNDKFSNAEYDKEKAEIIKVNKIASEFFHNNLSSNNKNNIGYVYAQKRNISDQIIETFGMGYASSEYQNLYNKLKQKKIDLYYITKSGLMQEHGNTLRDKFRDRLIFSIYDLRGNIIGFSGRYLGGRSQGGFEPPRYLNSPETVLFKKSKILYGIYQAREAISKNRFVVLVEGQMNVISSYSVGVKNVVASLGTSITPDQIALLKRFTTNIYLALDSDNAGKKALLRVLEIIYQAGLTTKVITWDNDYGKDPDEVIQKNKNVWIEAVNSAQDPVDYFLDSFAAKYEKYDQEKLEKFLKVILKVLRTCKDEIYINLSLKKIAKRFELNENSINKSFENLLTGMVVEIAPQRESNNTPQKEGLSFFEIFLGVVIQYWTESRESLLLVSPELVPAKYSEIYLSMAEKIDEPDFKKIYESFDIIKKDLIDNITFSNLFVDESVRVEEHLLKLVPLVEKEMKRNKLKELYELYADDEEKALQEYSVFLEKFGFDG